MGLYSQVLNRNTTSERPVEHKKKTGLLSRIKRSSDYDSLILDLSEFTRETGCERFALLCLPPLSDRYCSVYSQGFDVTTIRRMIPTQTEIDGVIKKNGIWVSVLPPLLSSFFPWFSSRERDSLESLALYSCICNDVRMCLVAASSRLSVTRLPLQLELITQESEVLIERLEAYTTIISALAQQGPINQDKEVLLSRIHASLEDGKIANLFSLSFSNLFDSLEPIESDERSFTLYLAMIHRLKHLVGPANCMYTGQDKKVRIVVFSSKQLDHRMYLPQIMDPMESLFAKHRLSSVTLSLFPSTSHKQDIISFLFGET